VNFGANCALENVTVRDDAIGVDEEATASRKLLAARVESLDCNRGGFDATNEFGEKILRGSIGSCEEEQ
jgi:hypothetical protein